jgi:hypothetical protein
MQKPWIENDELFHSELRKGHKYQLAVAMDFLEEGLWVKVPPLVTNSDGSVTKGFSDEGDILVRNGDRVYRIECKSRNIVFSGAHDFPWPTAYVGNKGRWDKILESRMKPCAVLIISQKTMAKIVIPMSTKEKWRVEHTKDSVRGQRFYSYTVDRKFLRDFDDLLEWITRDES